MKSFGEKRLVKSVKFLSLSIKSINPIQKYPHITELYAYILKIFVCIFLLPINFLISFGKCSVSEYSSRFITYALSFIFKVDYL